MAPRDPAAIRRKIMSDIEPSCSANASVLELKGHGHYQLHCNWLIVQIRWLIFPLPYRVQGRGNQQGVAGDESHLDHIALGVDHRVDGHNSLHFRLLGQRWIVRSRLRKRSRGSDAATYANRCSWLHDGWTW